MTVGSKGGSKHGELFLNIILGIGIPYLSMNLMSFHGFFSKIYSIVVLNCAKRML